MQGDCGVIAAEVTGNLPDSFWHGTLVERSINTIAGPSGVGKSILVTKIVADVSRHGKVIYCNHEDDRIVQKFRLEVAGADLSNVILAGYVLPDELDQLERDVRLNQARMVVFDTAEKAFNAPIQRWGRPLNRLQHQILEPYNCAALFVHHTIRSVKASADWRGSVGGATNGLQGSSRTISLVGRRDEQVIMCPVKSSYSETPSATAFEFYTEDVTQANGEEVEIAALRMVETGILVTNPTELVVVSGGNTGTRGPEPAKSREASKFLTDVLAYGPVPVKDCGKCLACGEHTKATECCGDVVPVLGLHKLAENAGVSFGTLKRSKSADGIESSRKGAKENSIPYWRLPKDHPALSPNAVEVLA